LLKLRTASGAAIVAVWHRPDNLDLVDFEVVVSGRTNRG
jgi:hypothetical protein